MTVKCRKAIKVLFHYFNLCLSVKLNSLSCSFTFIFFLTSNLLSLQIRINSRFGNSFVLIVAKKYSVMFDDTINLGKISLTKNR